MGELTSILMIYESHLPLKVYELFHGVVHIYNLPEDWEYLVVRGQGLSISDCFCY